MKIRKLILFGVTLLIVAYLVSFYLITSIKSRSIDISAINDVVKTVQGQIENDTLLKQNVEDYSVALLSDDNYQSTVNKALQQEDIIRDLIVKKVIVGKVIFPSPEDNLTVTRNILLLIISMIFLFLIIALNTILAIFKVRILKPFHTMENFASKVARGELDIPLGMDPENYFGAFTESFDLMREELKKAKEGEYQANLSKKELVASLSHDIKTPVATIKACCEVLNIKLQENPNVDKIKIIFNKADVIDKLISNMFHATLEELHMLKIEPMEELSSIIPSMFQDMNHFNKIIFNNTIPDCLIYCDKLRLGQVVDNVINNSYKYADTDIYVTYTLQDTALTIEIRDCGNGVPEEELPLIFEKYYRGKNGKKKTGSGLGLYLSRQFMEGMKGLIEFYNDDGFVVVLHIRIV